MDSFQWGVDYSSGRSLLSAVLPCGRAAAFLDAVLMFSVFLNHLRFQTGGILSSSYSTIFHDSVKFLAFQGLYA